jgi:hypothetical protein
VREALPGFLKSKVRDGKDSLRLSADLGRHFGYKAGMPFGAQSLTIERADKKASGSRLQWRIRHMRPTRAAL